MKRHYHEFQKKNGQTRELHSNFRKFRCWISVCCSERQTPGTLFLGQTEITQKTDTFSQLHTFLFLLFIIFNTLFKLLKGNFF